MEIAICYNCGWLPEGETARGALSHPVDHEGVAGPAIVGGDEVLYVGANVLPLVLDLQKIELRFQFQVTVPSKTLVHVSRNTPITPGIHFSSE